MTQTIRHYCTRAEAITLIDAAPRGVKFALSVRNAAPVTDETGKSLDSEIYCGLSTYVDIDRKQAARLARDMLAAHTEAKGGRLPIRIAKDESQTVYWIGA